MAEYVIPISIVVALVTNAVVISYWSGRISQKVEDIQGDVGEIKVSLNAVELQHENRIRKLETRVTKVETREGHSNHA